MTTDNIDDNQEFDPREGEATRIHGINVPAEPEAHREVVTEVAEYFVPVDDYAINRAKTLAETGLGEGLECRKPNKSGKAKVKADFTIEAFGAQREGGAEAVAAITSRVAEELDGLAGVESMGPFINILLDRKILAQSVLAETEMLGEGYGANNSGNNDKVVLDVSSPNVAKSMHLGHLRSTVIGEALARLMTFNGKVAIRDNHLGDWGTQFGILAHAYDKWADEVPELQDPETQVAGLQKLYVRINTAIAEEKEATKTEDDKDGSSELEDEGRNWFVRLEQGDPKARELWQWARDLSMVEFYKIYELLGVDFEYLLGESAYVSMNDDIYLGMENAGVAGYDHENTLRLKPSQDNLQPLAIRKPDGSSLYSTRDLACLFARCYWFDPKEILYVVGGEQSDYFRSVFDSFKQVMGDDCPDIQHIGFGLITLPEGKMSTRKGNVIFLNDVIDEATNKAYEKIKENMAKRELELPDEQVKEIAKQVAVGAIIYFDLKQTADRKIVFDWDEVLNFQGNSGPYLQYAHTRMAAILELAQDEDLEREVDYDSLELTESEEDLVALIADFPNVIKKAGDDYSTAELSEFLYKLAHTFNGFYKKVSVLKESDPNLLAFRLKLLKGTQQVLHNGLEILNIPMPEVM